MEIDNSTPLHLSSTTQLMELRYGQIVRIGGTISKLLPKVSKAGRHTKPGRDIDLLILQDLAGEVEVLAFRDTLASCEPQLQVGMPIVVTGAAYCAEKPKIFADQVVTLSVPPKTDENPNRSPEE